jgi:hypothetical protein
LLSGEYEAVVLSAGRFFRHHSQQRGCAGFSPDLSILDQACRAPVLSLLSFRFMVAFLPKTIANRLKNSYNWIFGFGGNK